MLVPNQLRDSINPAYQLGEITGKDNSGYISERFGLWPHFDEADLLPVMEILTSGRVNRWTGEQNTLFEQEFADYCGSKYAIAVFNGTIALEMALAALDIGAGDEVITTCRTFIASASSIVMRGAKPVLADIDPISQNITAETIKPLINNNTKAIICVHHAGWPCDMESISGLVKTHNLKIIEDCAQSHGAEYRGKMTGSFGDISAFSFCQDKIITTGGEGGLVLTDDEALYQKMWAYKDHGKDYSAVYERSHPIGFRWLHETFGTNFRMTEIQAALGRVALRKLPKWLEKRRTFANLYNQSFKDTPALRLTIAGSEINHAYYKYYCFIRPELIKPDWDIIRIIENINAHGVPVMSGSCWNISEEVAFKQAGWNVPADKLPNAHSLKDTSLLLLLHPTLTEEDIVKAAEIVKNVISEASM